MNIAALLTAREGSKSVPNKNLYKLNKIPLYIHNIYNALGTTQIENVYVSTDCKQIIETCNDYENDRLRVIVRPDHLCQDDSSHYDAIMHGLGEIEKREGELDMLVILLGNTPHAYPWNMNAAIKMFIERQDHYDSCISVSKFNMFNPYRSFHIDENNILKPVLDSKAVDVLQTNNKDAFGDCYFFNGSFWVCKRRTLVNNDGNSVFPWLGNKILPYVQPEGYQEVDAEWQLKLL